MSRLDLYTAGRLLGHADLTLTERDVDLDDDHAATAGRISGIVHSAMRGNREEDPS